MSEAISNNIKALLREMQESGVPFDSVPQLDGRIHRYCKDDSRERDEWYCGHEFEDGNIVCVYGSWSGEQTKKTFKSWVGDPVKDDYVLELRRVESQEREVAHKEAAKRASAIYTASEGITDHAYLDRKKINALNPHLRQEGDRLILPIYDIHNKFLSLQYIFPDGKKRFLADGQTSCGHLVLGDLTGNTIYFAEGFATADSINQAMDSPTVCCFSASNVTKVALLYKALYPNKKLVNCLDLGSAGDKVASEWDRLKLGMQMRPKKEMLQEGEKDFNDVFVRLGSDECRKQVEGDRLLTRSITEFLALDIPPLEWIIDEMYVKGSTNLIYSPPGVGKSMVAYEIAWCVAGGFEFLSRKVSKPQKVLYIDGEMTDREINTRIKMILERRPPVAGEMFSLITADSLFRADKATIDLYHPETRNRLDRLIAEHDFIVFDNVTSLTMPGEQSHNNPNNLASWHAIDSWLAKWRFQGKTILVVHHANKGGTVSGTDQIRRAPMSVLRLEKIKHKFDCLSLKITEEKGRHLPEKQRETLAVVYLTEQQRLDFVGRLREVKKTQKDFDYVINRFIENGFWNSKPWSSDPESGITKP